MMVALNRATLLLVVELLDAARSGVTYTAKLKASCPACGQQLHTVSTKPWSGCVRIRYHKCINPDCLLSMLGQSVKSIEEI
jgi:hypothetical protein